MFSARRWLVLHRRLVSVGLTFCSVLCGLLVLSPRDGQLASTSPAGTAIAIDDDLLQFPLRLADAEVAELLNPGDVVDVIGSELRGSTSVVAVSLPVVDVPETSGGAFGAGGDGLVVVAVSAADALDLAAAAARGPLTVAVHP